MSTVVKSGKAYTGTKVLPNIIDYISTLADKTAYLKKIYASVGGDTSYITSANADSLFLTLKNHRDRVIADGGVVLSMAHTLRAIIFAAKNNLSSSGYSAFSADFGLKLSGVSVIKLYDLSARDQEILTGSFTRLIDANLNVISASGQSTIMSRASFITGANGVIIGSSSHEPNSDTTTLVRSPTMLQNSAGTGTSLGSIENNNGNVARFSYTLATGSTNQITYSQAGSAYIKYAGIVGLSIGGGASYMYENGTQKGTSASASKDLTGIAIYPGSTINSVGATLNENWIINSTSQDLAKNLSVHLNKSVFN